jgi:4-hydroxy-tetrahydrodipicolinate synthase
VGQGKRDGSFLRGAFTALVTPFGSDGSVDFDALAGLVSWQIDSGIHGLMPCGTTGEGATLDEDELVETVSTVVRAAQGRVPVVAGCGSNDTRRTVAAAVAAAEAGADGLLVVSPYYNKPNHSGMLAHYETIGRCTSLPVVVYNVPGRTGQNLGADLILELASLPGIAGVKEASGNLEQIAAILERRPAGFAVLSGDDALALPTLSLGAEGLVSVVSNEAPRETSELVEAALEGDYERARELHFRLLPLMRANFLESNPVPVKTALGILGRCSETLRAPLGPPTDATRVALGRALTHAGLGGSKS